MKKIMWCCLLWVGFGAVYGQAFAEMEEAANAGIVEGQFNLGIMYYHGKDVAMDKTKALYWFEKAANQGNAKAQYLLATMYFLGYGTIVDKKQAAYWVEQAYKNGSTDAKDFWEENELSKYK